MKKIITIAWKTAGWLMLLFVLLFGLLQTPPGKRLLAAGISSAASRPEKLTVKVGRIRGLIPARMELESLEIGDRGGTWLTASNLHCRWIMQEWINGVVHVDRLGAERIELHRLPQSGGEPRQKEPVKLEPFELVVDSLEVVTLVVGEGVAGVEREYAVHSDGIRLQKSGAFSGVLEVAGDATGRVEVFTPSPEMPQHRVELALKGRMFGLAADAHATVAGNAWAVEFRELGITYSDVLAFDLQGTLGSERIDLNGALAEFDLAQSPLWGLSNFTGRATGCVTVGGTLEAPEMTAGFDVLEFTTAQAALDELPDLNFHVDALLAGGTLAARSSITNSVSGKMKAGLEMPCCFTMKPFSFAMEPRKLTASFKADVDLGILNGLTFFNGQRVQGWLDSELHYDVGKRLNGHVALRDGAYEHYGLGVVLHDIAVEMDALPKGLVVRTASATDGGDGRVSLSGRVGLWEPDVPLELVAEMTQAKLIRRDEVDAVLSGSVRADGPLARPKVAGKVVVDRADILLDNIAPPEPRLLTNYDAEAPGHKEPVAKTGSGLPFDLDLEVSMPDRIFASASMIDSVWGGNLRIKDAPGGVSVAGVIHPRRGYLSFIGKKFRLQDDGRIDFDGAIPPSPSVNIGAEYSRSDIVAHLVLTGKLDRPEYTLTSTPAMPEDEVLSHVLFGRDTSSISAYQAYQIAAAARQLSGGMSGPGFMYQMRQALGIDTLEWREPDSPDGRSSVAAGKYLTPGLYVEVNSTFEDQGMGVAVEYELSRHFSVETSAGPQMRPGIGLNWKNDY